MDNLVAAHFNTLLVGLFAIVAAVIMLIGLYGLISCDVSQSAHEISIRLALGAHTSDVLRVAVGRGMLPGQSLYKGAPVITLQALA